MNKLLYIFIGGGLGASARYAISLLTLKLTKPIWVGTFLVNVIGCLVLGYIFGFALSKPSLLPENIKLGITVGFLGGLTTFSTFGLETFTFLKDGKLLAGVGYILASCVMGILCAGLGYWLANRI
jgi:CrcB protein